MIDAIWEAFKTFSAIWILACILAVLAFAFAAIAIRKALASDDADPDHPMGEHIHMPEGTRVLLDANRKGRV